MILQGWTNRTKQALTPFLTGPPILAFLPAITLGAFWVGGETALIGTSLGLPLLLAFCGIFDRERDAVRDRVDPMTGLLSRTGFEADLERTFDQTREGQQNSACFMLELDDLNAVSARHGQQAVDQVLARAGERIGSALRDKDMIARIANHRFAICLDPVAHLDLELCIQMSGRLQSAIEEPISLDGIALYLSCSIGFCMRRRAPDIRAESWLNATQSALTEALHHGPSTIRAFTPDMQKRSQTQAQLKEEAVAALENGEIQPWYQPQISTDTGQATGFEVLARWHHPVRGTLAPDTFLPALQEAGLSERLSQVMLYHAMTALKAWDNAGQGVPRVGVNFAMDELRNPGLVDRIQWELDRFDLTPDRLAVEVLETVVSDSPDDMVTRNVIGLSMLGCCIDLDDFGTGHASISAIKRFRVSRIKIDRSFVTKADRDPDQQRLIGAVLTMAERLELETLAEGVETVGEHALLAQLGCDHVQGFGIGRPMPFDQTLDWISRHRAKLKEAPPIGRQTG